MNINFPFKFDGRGRTAIADESQHIRQMIEQLIFTNPGERVNRPTFGSGVLQLIFAPNSPELAATVQFTMEAALQQWLGDVIEIRNLRSRGPRFNAYCRPELFHPTHQRATVVDSESRNLIEEEL